MASAHHLLIIAEFKLGLDFSHEKNQKNFIICGICESLKLRFRGTIIVKREIQFQFFKKIHGKCNKTWLKKGEMNKIKNSLETKDWTILSPMIASINLKLKTLNFFNKFKVRWKRLKDFRQNKQGEMNGQGADRILLPLFPYVYQFNFSFIYFIGISHTRNSKLIFVIEMDYSPYFLNFAEYYRIKWQWKPLALKSVV